MNGTCSTHRRGEKCIEFWSEDLGIDGRVILEWIRIDLREIWWEGVDWIHLAQDRDQW